MPIRTHRVSRTGLPKTFAELNALHMLRPIHDKIDLENAQEIVEPLALLGRRTKDQEDYLETLSTLIEKYEQEHDPVDMSELDPVDILKSLMEGRGMSASDLGRLLGERSLGQKVLSGARELSKRHMSVLGEHFSVSPAIFFGDVGKLPRK